MRLVDHMKTEPDGLGVGRVRGRHFVKCEMNDRHIICFFVCLELEDITACPNLVDTVVRHIGRRL